MVDHLASIFIANQCDGLFLPAVDHLGIRVPIHDIVRRIERGAELRCVSIDTALPTRDASLYFGGGQSCLIAKERPRGRPPDWAAQPGSSGSTGAPHIPVHSPASRSTTVSPCTGIPRSQRENWCSISPAASAAV